MGTVISIGFGQLASAVLTVLSVIALIVGCIVLALIVISFILSVRAWLHDRRHQGAHVRTVPVRVVPDPTNLGDSLALVCGVCNGVRGAWRCACSGHCGSQRCRGAGIHWDLTGELEQIRQDRRG